MFERLLLAERCQLLNPAILWQIEGSTPALIHSLCMNAQAQPQHHNKKRLRKMFRSRLLCQKE